MQELLEAGEYAFGGYKVQFVDWSEGEWRGAGYWLRAVVTNRRLLVYPETQRAGHLETVLPSDIVKAWNLCMNKRDGILLLLKDKRRLYMLVEWSQGSKLLRDINELIKPPLKPRIIPRLQLV